MTESAEMAGGEVNLFRDKAEVTHRMDLDFDPVLLPPAAIGSIPMLGDYAWPLPTACPCPYRQRPSRPK